MGKTASADDVFLKNGTQIRRGHRGDHRHPGPHPDAGGVVSLPKSQVLRVEAKDSDLSGYLRRKEALRQEPRRAAPRTGSNWPAGPRPRVWSRAPARPRCRGRARSRASEGVATLLRGYKYSFDEAAGRWISYEESMRKRGLCSPEGAWISREELAERAPP